MNGLFLYFFSGIDRDKLTRQDVSQTWLADVLTDELRTDVKFRSVTKHFVNSGPGGASGIIIAAANPSHIPSQPIGYFPDRQTWVDVGGTWLGYDNVERPHPEALRREKLTAGHEVILGDGNSWIAPVIRKHDEGRWSCNLPMKTGLNPAGEYTEAVRADVAWAWDAACELWNARYADGGITKGRFLEVVTKLLGLNYRIGPHEVFALDLFDSENMTELVFAFLDVAATESWCEAQESKKNQTAASP